MPVMPTRLFGKAVLLHLISSAANPACVADSCLVKEGTDETSLVQIMKTLSRHNRSKLSKVLDSSEDLKLTKNRWQTPWQEPWEAIVGKAMESGRQWRAGLDSKGPGKALSDRLMASKVVGDAMKVAAEQLIAGKTAADVRTYTLRINEKLPWRSQEQWRGLWQNLVSQAMKRGKQWHQLLATSVPQNDRSIAMEVVGDAMKVASDELAQEFEATTQAKANHQTVDLTAKSSVAEHMDLQEVKEEEGLQEGTEQADGSKKMWAGKTGTGPWAKFVEQALSSGKEWRGVLDEIPELYQGRRRWGEVTARDLKADPVPVNEGGPMLPAGPPVAAPMGTTLVNGPNMGYPVAAIGSPVMSSSVAGGLAAGTAMGSSMASMGTIPEVLNKFAADGSEMSSDGVSANTGMVPVSQNPLVNPAALDAVTSQLQPMANPEGGIYASQNAVASAYAQAQQAALNAAKQVQDADNQMLAALSADETEQIAEMARMKNAQVMAALQ